MSVNSAEPDRLVQYARAVVPSLRESDVAFDSCHRAVLTHNRLNPGFPVDLSPVSHARSILLETQRSLEETVVIAEAFVAADRSGGTLRTASDLSLLGHTARIIAARRSDDGGTSRPEGIRGFYREKGGPFTLGPVEGDARGALLLGFDHDGGFNGPRIEDGAIVVDGRLEGFLGLRLDGDATVEMGPATADVEGQLSAGVTIEADGNVSIGRDGVDVRTGIDASVAARAEAKGTLDLGPFTASGGCEAAYGAGVTARNTSRITWDEIRVESALGLIVGPGAGCEAGLSFSPREITEGVVDGGKVLWNNAEPVVSGAIDVAGDLWDDAWSVGENLVDGGGQAVGAVLDWLR